MIQFIFWASSKQEVDGIPEAREVPFSDIACGHRWAQEKGTMRETTDRDQNKATSRVLAVLSAFVSKLDGNYGVTELGEKLGMTKNMVYRAVTTLTDQGFLIRDAGGTRYELGLRILELQNATTREPDLRGLCAPTLQEIYKLTGETVSLSVRRGDNVVFIDGVETHRPGTWRNQIGDSRPLHSVASSRAVLAFLPDTEIDDYIARKSPLKISANEELSTNDLWDSIRLIREQGYSRYQRTARPRMMSVAFPIWDSNGRVQGAVAVGGPQDRFGEAATQLLPQLQQIVAELNERTRLYPAAFSFFLNDSSQGAR
jgi:DNA-binding IclR family transcriptional regulator